MSISPYFLSMQLIFYFVFLIPIVTTFLLWFVKRHNSRILIANWLLTAIIAPVGILFFLIFMVKSKE